MTDISNLCMECLGTKNESGICTRCGKEEDIEAMAHTACYGNGNKGTIGGFVVLGEEDVANIYRLMVK